MEWGEFLFNGCRMSARCLDSSYVGEPGRDTMGRGGILGLWIWGSP